MYEPVADTGECRRLFERSRWNYDNAAYGSWVPTKEYDGFYELRVGPCDPWLVAKGMCYPAYDAAFLIRHLPAFTLTKSGNVEYLARWTDHSTGEWIQAHSRHQPENALCRLAILLIDAGIILTGQPSPNVHERGESC